LLNLGLIGAGFAVGYFFKPRRLLVWAWLLSLVVNGILLYGIGDVPRVPTDQWGGLLLTLTLAIVSIIASFPLGVLLAVGRQSTYPAIRGFCTLYIELIRGVPLITLLFMLQIMLPLFLPQEFTVERAIRAMVALTLFTAAYVAEIVRGGLQAIPRGQSEAARALGLNSALTLLFIILPQALRLTIPAMVGQFISLFKDTSLVAIVGLLDLARIANAAANQPEFLGQLPQVYTFIAAIYFVIAFAMSYGSRRLEKSLGVGER
jgi:general L-amino acid transport system permease protein